MNNKRSVCIVGAGGGIGSSAARLFKEEGYEEIILMDLPSEALNKVATEIDGYSIDIDLRETQSIEMAFAVAKKRLDSIHALLLISGAIENGNLSNMTIDLWNEIISTNLSGFFLCAQAAEHWLMDDGRIVTLGSMAGHQASMITGPAYAASKGGVESLTKYLARYFAGRKITANCITPGPVDTPMLDAHDPNLLAAAKSLIPLRRFAESKEIAAAALYLCSANAGYTTGSVLSINGGTRME